MELNNEQRNALFLPPVGVYLVKGVAGSGKTTIAMARALQLYNLLHDENLFCQNTINVGVFTYNKALKQYINGLFDTNSQRINHDQFHLEVTTVHSYISRECLQGLNYRTIYDPEFTDLIFNHINFKELTPNLCNRKPDFFCDEFKWFKGMMIHSLDEYLKTRRKGREGRLSDDDKKVMWQLYEKVYEDQMERGVILYDDFPNIAMTGRVEPFFDAIIIDEAQDLSKACLTYLSRLVKEETQSIMILADAAQSIYTNGITWKDAGFAVHGSRSIELKQNYRNPVSVYKVASCIIGKVHDSEDFVNDGAECARRQNTAENEKVTIIHCGTQEKEREVLLKCLKYLRTTHPDCSVGILVKTNEQRKYFSSFLAAKEIRHVIINPKDGLGKGRLKITSDIYMVTIHSAKGLEFDYVVILDVNESNFVSAGEDFELNDQIRKLLYTSLTRARKNAYIFSSEMEYSKMLDDIDKELIKMRDLRVKPQEGADNKQD